MMIRTFLTSALDMPEIMSYIYSKSWKLQFSASSSIIIIEDYYLQTFLHSLNYSPYNHEETLDTNKYHFNMFFLQLDTLKYYFELPASLFSFLAIRLNSFVFRFLLFLVTYHLVPQLN